MTATLLRAVVIAVYHLTVTCRTILAFSLGLRRLINTRDRPYLVPLLDRAPRQKKHCKG